MNGSLILNASQIQHTILRLAYEVCEKNYDAQSLRLIGIKPRGNQLAHLLMAKLKEIEPEKKISLMEVEVDKDSATNSGMVLSEGQFVTEQNEVVILVDDVVYSGKTLINTLLPFLQTEASAIQILVLVNRDYLRYPIRPDFIGLSLATTTKEHVKVCLDQGNEHALLY